MTLIKRILFHKKQIEILYYLHYFIYHEKSYKKESARYFTQGAVMGRTGITYENVAKAAAEILAEGAIPTIERIRVKLETGSYSTLGTLLKEWRAKHALQQ